MFMTGVWYLDFYLNMVTVLWYTHVPNFYCITWFLGWNYILVLKVLIWGFGGCWRFLTWVWHLGLDLDIVTGFWYTNDLNFGSLSWFLRCKEYSCWMFLTGVLDLYIVLDMVTGLWYTHVQSLGSLSWFIGCQEQPCPSSPDLRLWRMLEVPDWGLASW